MKLKRKNVYKMTIFNRLWKNINVNKREIKEVNFAGINLKEYIIIDVRSRREFREGHLNGAINIPLPEVKKSIERYVKSKEDKLLIYCQCGIRSKRAVEQLEELGYIQVYNLKGGLENI